MLNLIVGLTRTTGEAGSHSYAASAILEVELDPDLIDQPDRLQEHARHFFHLAREYLGQDLNPRDAPGCPPNRPWCAW
jgi:hypothetical protein